jgi:hypothetical protein
MSPLLQNQDNYAVSAANEKVQSRIDKTNADNSTGEINYYTLCMHIERIKVILQGLICKKTIE